MPALQRLTVRGFKSIRELENFELRNLNVLIGANGAGKSNFISLFELLAKMMQGNLQLYVKEHGGSNAFLHGTRKRTEQIDAEFYFDRNGYRISLRATGDSLFFAREEPWFKGNINPDKAISLGSGHDETRLTIAEGSIPRFVRGAIAGWRVYHFHDTSLSGPMRQAQPVRDNLRLKPDAGNIAPFLRMLHEKHPDAYRHIVETIRLVAPFFGDLVHREELGERIELEWFQRGDPDTPYSVRQLSDGTLRFICLVTLLLQPTKYQPDTILIDEPELGLHPYALVLLAGLLRQASDSRQIIVSTQSVELVNELNPEDIVVVHLKHGESTFAHLNAEQLAEWLEEYTLGEMWKMNIFGGRPTR